jgi:hypothetical protein
VSDEPLKVVEEIRVALTTEDVVAGLAEQREIIEETFARLAAPDFDVVMVGAEYNPRQPQAFVGSGPEGFTRVWEEWTSVFERFRIEIEETRPAGEEKVVMLVTLVGRTQTGGVDISQPAAAVWTVWDGKLTRVEFHLDRERALKSAGLEPQSRQE